MKKAELFARYYLFGNDVAPITPEAFQNVLSATTLDNLRVTEDGSAEILQVITDGMDYYQFTCTWKVGWEGDVDCDTFYCKVETVTQARMKEIMALLEQPLSTLFTK